MKTLRLADIIRKVEHPKMRIAGLVQDSIVDGPGFRFVVFAQGCLMHCDGCHNPETWDPNGGSEKPESEIISEMLGNKLTDGLTLSGGEPFLQPVQCVVIASAAKENGLNVWAYSGYTFEEILIIADTTPAVGSLLNLTDVLIDGRFIAVQKAMALRWRGSKNQRVLDVAKSLAAGKAVELETS